MTVTVVAENRRPADICFKDLWQTFGQNEPTNEKPILNKSGGVVGITVCTRRELYWRVIGDNNEETTCAEDRSECCTITMRGRHICGSHLSVKADLQIFCSTSKSLVRYVGAENMSNLKLFVRGGF